MFNRKYSGVTLIESMLALSLSLLLLTIVFSLFLAGQKHFTQQKNMLAMQTKINLTKQILVSSVQQAGFLGCARLTPDFPLHNTTSVPTHFLNKIAVSNKKQTGFRVWFAGKKAEKLLRPMQDLTRLTVSPSWKIKPNDILVISDCKSIDIFTVANIFTRKHEIKIQTLQPLSKLYATDADVMPLHINTFYYKKKRLYWQSDNTEPVELIDHIQQVSLHYVVQSGEHTIEKSGDELAATDMIQGVTLFLQFDKNDLNFQPHWYLDAANREK